MNGGVAPFSPLTLPDYAVLADGEQGGSTEYWPS